MENKAAVRIVIVGLVLVLGLGMVPHAHAVGCSYTQLKCIDICEADDTPHETCVKDCGCSEGEVGLRHSHSGLQHAGEAVGCSYTQLKCIDICQADDTPFETCVKDCGCSEDEVGLLRSKQSGDGRCRLGCSSKCNDPNKFTGKVKEQCNDVCYSLCAKGVDITATAA